MSKEGTAFVTSNAVDRFSFGSILRIPVCVSKSSTAGDTNRTINPRYNALSKVIPLCEANTMSSGATKPLKNTPSRLVMQIGWVSKVAGKKADSSRSLGSCTNSNPIETANKTLVLFYKVEFLGRIHAIMRETVNYNTPSNKR